MSAVLAVATRPAFEVSDAALAPKGAAKSERSATADKMNAVILFVIMSFLISFGKPDLPKYFTFPLFALCCIYACIL